MMNNHRNNLRDSLIGTRNFAHPLRRGHSLSNGLPKDGDENLDLFSKNRRSLSIASSDESSDGPNHVSRRRFSLRLLLSNYPITCVFSSVVVISSNKQFMLLIFLLSFSQSVSVKLGRLSLGSAKLARNVIDDLLSTEGGKNDYDWLLTPPGTPLFPSSDGTELQPISVAPRTSSSARSSSTTKASRLSVSQSESHHSSRPTRSSSVTRPSVSSSQFSTYSSNRSSSILNTSSASVSSYIRPSSPITRSPSTARPSTPSTRQTPSRSSTPSRVRPTPSSSSVDKPRPSPSSRPSTPNSRMQIPTNLNSTASRPNSRTSTPTRRTPVSSASAGASPATSTGRVPPNGRIPASTSRPSSPSPRVRSLQLPAVPPDFSLDTPPNLRTTLPDRPLSAGRSRPGAALTVKVQPENTSAVNAPRRHSSPIVSRGRVTEPPGRGRVYSNGHGVDAPEPRKTSQAPELGMRKPVRTSSSTANESTGFGRTISKKSIDMAIRHMDIKNGPGNNRSLTGTTLFPQSIRSGTSKTQSARSWSAPGSVNNGSMQNGDRYVSEANDGRYSAKLSEVDIYESSRYDAILLKEDLKNTSWLHSIDDKSDEGPIFDNGFETLPEPFGLL